MACSGDHHREGCEHEAEVGTEINLYQKIFIDKIRCFNEAEEGQAKSIFKSFEMRMDRAEYLESDVDEQLLLIVPFTGLVKLKSILVRGRDGNAPNKMKVWINREDFDFEMADNSAALQEWDLVNAGEIISYQTKVTKFQNVRSITMFFPGNFSDSDVTVLDYLGFKGEWEELKDEPVVTVYELNANPADHPKAKDEFMGARFV